MRGFDANICRLCEKVFCCEKCRIKHESNFHKVFPSCDICIYGNFVFGALEETLLQHLEISHLPLNCVYCKRIFASIEEILQHKKCPVLQYKRDSPKTPFNQVNQGTPGILVTAGDQDSPILQELNYIFNLATSTPMQKGQEPNGMFDKSNLTPVDNKSKLINNGMFDKSKDLLTPVDDKSKSINKSIIKKRDSSSKSKADNSSKRRVTFGETPSNISIKDQHLASPRETECSDQIKYSDTTHTPVTGMSTGQFYSAKSEIDQFSSAKSEGFSNLKEHNSARPVTEGFTPLSVPNMPKLINVKGNIYKPQDSEPSSLVEQRDSLVNHSEDSASRKSHGSNLAEVSMEICSSPTASSIVPLPANTPEECPDTAAEKAKADNSEPSTPVGSRATSNKVTVKEVAYKNTEPHGSAVSQILQEIQGSRGDEQDKENKPENDQEIKKPQGDDGTNECTVWLSATNLNNLNDSEEHNYDNGGGNQPDQQSKSNSPESPQKPSGRRVSIVMPTPILKRTNVQMKFHIPAHLSSTPIMSSGIVKLKQTKIVEEISAKVIRQQTPFQTPQGKISECTRRFMGLNIETVSDNGAGPSSARNELIHFTADNEINTCKDVTAYHSNSDNHQDLSQIPVTGVSVSSMTESTLWTSMTRIVKSVLEGFTNLSSQEGNNSVSFKRQLSDPDSSGEFLEAPRLKRFKFTDIKCRKPIRDLPALEPRRRTLASTTGQVATFEIFKSVSTLYGGPLVRAKCDKATQTDDYLMYGWHPKM